MGYGLAAFQIIDNFLHFTPFPPPVIYRNATRISSSSKFLQLTLEITSTTPYGYTGYIHRLATSWDFPKATWLTLAETEIEAKVYEN
jgi:hypothetical protein